ncbi:hypothetical protein ACF0H5_003629 [Mactra antiquata]
MKITLFLLVVLAVVTTVSSTQCAHGDPANCGITCTDSSMVVGCVEKEICTCILSVAPTLPSCTLLTDCDAAQHCGRGQSVHCLDGSCQCVHNN